MFYIIAVCAVTLFTAELIDKSQLILFSFSLKYNIKTVLVSIVIAAILTQGIFILIGYNIGKYLPQDLLKILTAAVLIFFSVKLFQEAAKHTSPPLQAALPNNPSPQKFQLAGILTIVSSLFLAELGDMTMLATLSFATTYPWYLVLIGASLGLIAANLFALLGAKKLAHKINHQKLSYLASLVCLGFGTIILFAVLQNITNTLLSLLITGGILACLGLLLQKIYSHYHESSQQVLVR